MNLAIFVYIGNVDPFKLRSTNKTELRNEILICIYTITFVIFTDFVPDYELQYNVGGWMYISFMAICISYNLYFVLKECFRLLTLILTLNWRRCKFNISKLKRQFKKEAKL